MIFNDDSLKIVLNLYKEDKINLEQVIQLIKDLYNNPSEIYTYPYYPQVTWETHNFPKYEVTCNTECKNDIK